MRNKCSRSEYGRLQKKKVPGTLLWRSIGGPQANPTGPDTFFPVFPVYSSFAPPRVTEILYTVCSRACAVLACELFGNRLQTC